MKYITLEAKDSKDILLGKQENFPIAETLEDVLAMESEDNGWNAEEIVACFNAGSRVKRQSQLRSEKDKKTPLEKATALAKKLTPAEIAEFVAALKAQTNS